MKTSINILGCCVSRDLFGLFKDEGGFEIKQCVTNVGVLSMCSPKISESYICTEENFPNSGNYLKRCSCLDINKNVFEYLAKYDSDYTVVDLGNLFSTFTLKVKLKEEINSEKFTYMTQKKPLKENPDFLKNAPFEILEAFRFPEHSELFLENIEKYADMLKNHIDQNKIIILELTLTQRYINNQGKIEIFQNFIDAESNQKNEKRLFDIPRMNKLLSQAYQIFEKALPNAHIVKFPNTEVLCNQNHKWGLHPLHYIHEYYCYLLDSIRAISCISDRESEKIILDRIRTLYSDLIRSRYRATADGEYTLENLSHISSDSIRFGEYITICLGAVGGTGKYTYDTYIKKQGDTSWHPLGTKKNGSVTYQPKHFGIYDVCVKLKDENHILQKKYFQFIVC